MLSARVQLRASVHLQEAYESAAQSQSCSFLDCKRLVDHVQELRDIVRRMDRAHRQHFELAAASLRATYQAELNSLAGLASHVSNALVAPRTVPLVRDILAEMTHLQNEFDEVRIDRDQSSLIALTEPIQFHWDRLSEDSSGKCFDVVAQEPNYPADNDSVTHPHVRNDSLCAGDASLALNQAVAQGRLAEAFLLIHSVLTHYNPRSPYVRLADWDGVRCGDCGRSCPEDDACCCAECGCSRCDECICSCGICGDSSCADCLRTCSACEADCCCQCVTRVGDGDRALCSTCLRKCPACEEKFGRDELDLETGLCPDCLPIDPETGQESQNPNRDPKEAGYATIDAVSGAEAKARVLTTGLAETPVSVPPRAN
jgi:hypothetical protein